MKDLILELEGRYTDFDAFKKALAPAIEWYRENCDPHQTIVISWDLARVVRDDLGVPLEIPD